MMTADEIRAELDRTGTVIDGFREAARRGGAVELSGLDGGVEALCRAIAALPLAERRTLKPRLLDLIDRLNGLVGALGEQQKAIGDSMQGVTSRQRAMTAYGKSAGTSAPPGRGGKR